jgi:hypothetical protein
VCAVEVGEDLPSLQAGSRSVEVQLFGLFQQHVDRVDELVAAARIGACPGQLVCLRGPDPADVKGLAHLGKVVDESGEPADSGALGA